VEGLDLVQGRHGRDDVTNDLASSDHVAHKLPPAIGSGWNHLHNRAPVPRDAQWLARFTHLFNQRKTLGLEFGNRNIVHHLYFLNFPLSLFSLPQSMAARFQIDFPRWHSPQSRRSELPNLC